MSLKVYEILSKCQTFWFQLVFSSGFKLFAYGTIVASGGLRVKKCIDFLQDFIF